MKTCSICKAPIIPGAKFCINCGIPIDHSADWMPCSVCQKTVDKNEKYCPWCGNEISKNIIIQEAEKKEEPSISSSYAEMILVNGGKFLMGQGDDAHTVTLSPFKISNAPITQDQYEFVMKTNPSKLKGPNRPVECVNWCDAIIYCNKLSELQKLEPCYSIGNMKDLSKIYGKSPLWKHIVCDFNASGFRLPTEAEWEYAARGGQHDSTDLFSGSNVLDDVGWYGENSEISSHDVCQKKPNVLGLYDMSGNVAEWVFDEYGAYDLNSLVNPKGASARNGVHVKRGGSWLDDDTQCTVFFRSSSILTGKSSNLGFRICSRGY